MNDGAVCKGKWTAQGFLGFGQASVDCDDGTKVQVLYTYQDHWTGTATGRGQTDKGAMVEIWSGQNVLEYLDRKTGAKRHALPCESGLLYIS